MKSMSLGVLMSSGLAYESLGYDRCVAMRKRTLGENAKLGAKQR